MLFSADHRVPSSATDERPGASALWQALRRRLISPPLRRLGVQHLVLAAVDIEPVREALEVVGRALGLRLVLDSRDGDIVLLDHDLGAQLSPQLIAAFCEGRPCVFVAGGPAADGPQRSLVAQLQPQLASLALVRHRPGQPERLENAGPESVFDSVFDVDVVPAAPLQGALGQSELGLLQTLSTRRGDPDAPPLVAAYGPQSRLVFHFAADCVCGDAAALQTLRLQRELPKPLAHGTAPAFAAPALPLDTALWDLGVAAAWLPLHEGPADWWHTPLLGPDAVSAARFTRVPRYLEVLRRLAAGPVTPSLLRRQGRISVTDLRRVLQACLLLGLAHWAPAPVESAVGTPAWNP